MVNGNFNAVEKAWFEVTSNVCGYKARIGIRGTVIDEITIAVTVEQFKVNCSTSLQSEKYKVQNSK